MPYARLIENDPWHLAVSHGIISDNQVDVLHAHEHAHGVGGNPEHTHRPQTFITVIRTFPLDGRTMTVRKSKA